MTAPTISTELVDWAALAGFALTPEDHSGAALFWSDPGGEIRLYVRRSSEGYSLTWAERRSAEQFELSAPAIETMEKHLAAQFGSNFRSTHGLPRVRIPTKPDSLAVGYHLGEADDDGFRTLFDAQDNIVATAQGDLNAVSTLVKLSHLVSSSLVDIIASYQDPEGRPLFGV